MTASLSHLENSWSSFFTQDLLQEASTQRLKDLMAMCDPTSSAKTNIVKISNNYDLLFLVVAVNKKES
jgi:hypothetical protein